MAPIMNPTPLTPKAIAERGEQIYRLKYQADFEANHHGKFVAVNVNTQAATLGATPDEALENAHSADPKGMFHLIRVGFPSAFQISYAASDSRIDWLFG